MAVSILWTIDDASDADDEPLFQLSQDSVTTDLTTGGGKETRIKVDYLGDSVQCQLYLDRFFTARSPARDVYSAIEPHLLGVLNGIDATAFVRIGPRPPQSPLGVLFGETPLWDGVSSPEVVQPTDGIAVRVLKKLFLEMQSESLRGFDSYSVRMGFCCFMNAPDKPTDLLKNVKQQVPKNLEWGNSESVLPGKYVYLTTVVDTLRTLTKLLQSSSFRPVIHRLSYCLHFLILKAPADTAPAHAANAKVAHLVFTDIHEDHVQCAQRALAPAVQKLQSDRRNAGSPAAGLPRSASFFSDAGHDLLPGPGGLHMSPKAGQAAGQRPAQKKGPGNGSAQPEGILGSCFGLLKSSRSARLVMLAAAKVSGPLTSQQQVHADAAVQILAEVQKMGAVHGPTLVFPALPLHTVPGPALGAAVRPAYSPPVDHHLALVPSLRELSESPPRYSPPIPGRPMEIHDPNPYEDRLAGAMSVRRGMRAPSYIMGTTTPGGARRAHSPGRLHSPVGDRGFEGMDPVGNFDTNALVNTPYAQTPTTYLQSTARLIARQSMGQAPLGDHVGPGFRHVHPLNQRDPDNNEHPIPDAPTSYDSTAIDAFPSMPAHHTAVYPGDSPPAPPTRVPYNFSEQYSLSLSQARNTVAGVQAARHASPAPHLMHKRAAATPPAAGGGRSEVLIRDCRIHELEGLVGNLEARLVELGGVNGETWLSRVEVEAVRRENEELKMELSALSKRSEAEGNSWRSRIVALESEHTARLHELQTVLRREAYGDKQSPAAADHRALQAHVFELEQRCLRAEQDREDAVLRGRAVGATSEDLKTQIAGLRASSAELEARLQSEAIARDAADKDVDRLQQINQHTMEQLSAIRRSTAEYEMERRMTRSEMDATRAQENSGGLRWVFCD
ncbi:hypothetical protein DIPPA_24619 [Diplonema papillatum]|nr:hypothetical protein DIPPA_25541 [Diplonema papillatum]KAJ9464441.1 hypothetical protein DIPPA_24619 [Diplonema papillatum]